MDNLKILQTVFNNIPYDLTMFFVDNQELVDVFDKVERRGYIRREEESTVQDLVEVLDDHIRFNSEYNENIETYL